MNSNSARLVLAGAIALGSLPSLHAQTWDGGGGDANWGTAANWTGDTAPTFPSAGTLTFAGSTQLTANNEATGRTVTGITFDAAAGAFTLSGSAITLAGNIGFSAAPASAITQKVNLDLILNGNRTFSSSSGGLGTLVVNGNISETGGAWALVKGQLGTLQLTGSNSFTGALDIRAGVVSANSLAASGISSAIGAGSTIHLGGPAGTTTSILNYTGTSAATVNRTINLASSSSLAGGEIRNNGASGALTFTGTFTNSATHTTGTKSFTLTGTNTGDNTFQGVIGNSAGGGLTSFIKAGTGKWILAGANTYTGGTTVSAGTLSLAHQNAVQLSTLTLSGGSVVFDSTVSGNAFTVGALAGSGNLALQNNAGSPAAVALTVGNGNNSGSYSGVLSAAGSLTKTGSGTQTLTGTNTYTGGTNIGAGTLNFSTGGLGTTGAVTFTGNSTLQFGAATTTDLSSRLAISNGVTGTVDTNGNNVTFATSFGASGTGALTKIGTGTLSLNAANSFTGLTTVNAGTLEVGSGGSLASGNALTLGASGAADFANVGQTLGAVSNANTTTNALNFSAASGTVTLASLSGAGNTRFGNNGVVTGGISTGTVTSVGNLTANISGGGTTVTVGGLLSGNISAGTVGAGSLSATTVSGGTNTIGGVATIGTLTGGTANLNGATSAITTLSGGTVNLGSSTVLSVSGGTSAGVIAGNGGSLTKTGGGTLTLTGVSTYTGGTTVAAGTLTLHAASGASLANTTAVNVAGGATLSLGAANQINSPATLTLNGGTLALNGFNQTLGTLDLNASSALNLGDSASLTFANSSALDWNSSLLSVSNFIVGSNSLRFGTSSGGLTATQLGFFRFVEFGNASAQIDSNGFLAPVSSNYLNTGSTVLVISAPITGTITVTQSGTADTVLTGTNTSTGLATVTGGTLVIGTAAGGNWAGNVTVSDTGILKGRGDIGGSVVVDTIGTYSPGNSPGIQHIGSLTVNSGSFVTIELHGLSAGGGNGFHDQIISAGAVTLNGGTLSGATVFTGSTPYLPTLGTSYTIIIGSVITGTFAAYDFAAPKNSAGLSFLPEYTATAVNLYAVPDNYVTGVAELSANQTQVGAALQSLRNSGLPFELDQRTSLDARGTLFNGLKTQNAAGLRTAYDQLTPEKLTALAAATFQSASILNSSLQQRSAEMRRFGPASISLNGSVRPAAAEDYRVQTVIEDGVHYQIPQAKSQKHYGYFASATGAFATVDGAADRLGSFSQTGAATAGVDYALNETQSVGLVVSQALADTDFSSNSGSSRITTSRVGLFHDYHSGCFFLNTSVSAGFSSYDSKRKIAFLHQTARGETQGFSYGGQLATGYDLKLGDFLVGPTASVAYDHAQINGFDETGSAADLRVGRQNGQSLITKLGLHVSRPFVAQKISWIPDLSLSASRQSFNPNSITARLAAGGDAFRVNPQAGGSEYINPGASLSALLANGWTVRLSYDAILNPQYAEHRVNFSFGAGF